MSLQKVGHNRVAAAAGGTTDVNSVGHFKQPMWWLGLLLIIAGEGGNAFAYGLAPASTVAPFGGIGVFTNYVIAVVCLGENSRLGLGLGEDAEAGYIYRRGGFGVENAAGHERYRYADEEGFDREEEAYERGERAGGYRY